jgi:Hepatocellular carcinoma-associated antigen 59.
MQSNLNMFPYRAKIRNIEATEEAKLKLLWDRHNKKDGPSQFVPTNMAVNFVQHNRCKYSDPQLGTFLFYHYVYFLLLQYSEAILVMRKYCNWSKFFADGTYFFASVGNSGENHFAGFLEFKPAPQLPLK